MQKQQSPPLKSPPKIPEMEAVSNLVHDEPSNSVWDWNEFLDFNLDDQLAVPWDSDHHAQLESVEIPAPATETSDRVRKRDPRLSCSNYLAGLIPCACPELDEKMEEEERMQPGKKRARAVKASTATAKCQVPGCEVDISELKGYHRRHRVCLQCATASFVVLDGLSKRYCQQCGKFHILSDFDEGKRSCRRKLERHNNRRRRKPAESMGAVEKESQGGLSADDNACDDDAAKDGIHASSRDTEGAEVLLESEDGRNSTHCSALGPENIQGDSGMSFAASVETQMGGIKDDSKSLSPPYCDNKSAFSSTCPTGRISFKLYDWNPAEFPRRLRHQIFQWLASMPVELEGYIRPGCTILTAFVSMPQFMWVKLLEDPSSYIHDFIVKPGKMLSGRGTLFVHLNDMIFHVGKDKVTKMKVDSDVRPPKLHFVHPTCFEAGKPIEFIACGSNLSQPNFRFLVSFAGKYLAHDYCIRIPYGKTAGDTVYGFDHQLYKIHIPCTQPDLFGPAFIEVDNQSGLSNFIPILIGDKEVCSEMKTIQQNLDAPLSSEGSKFPAVCFFADACEVSALRQRTSSKFLVDIGWLLKEPALENMQYNSSLQIERFDNLLNILIASESSIILSRVVQYIDIWVDNMKLNYPSTGANGVQLRLFLKKVDQARDIVHHKFQNDGASPFAEATCLNQSFEYGISACIPTLKQEKEAAEEDKTHRIPKPTPDRSETVPLLNGEVVMNVNLLKEHPRTSCGRRFPRTSWTTAHPLVFMVAAVCVCFGVCAVILHPQKVVIFTTTVRRCLFNDDV